MSALTLLILETTSKQTSFERLDSCVLRAKITTLLSWDFLAEANKESKHFYLWAYIVWLNLPYGCSKFTSINDIY